MPTRIANGAAPPEPKVDYPLGRGGYSPAGVGHITQICNERGLGLVDLTQARFQRPGAAGVSSLRTPSQDYPGAPPKPDFLTVGFRTEPNLPGA